MGDPELRSDENILLRTPGIYVKSVPFEGVLTNKRIILVDRATNLLPPKEIPLVTIKDIEAGENAIRDQIITLSVLTRTGEKRQMILTFSRQTGGNRIRERDAWLKTLKENTSSTFDQVVRKVIPGLEKPPKRPEKSASPRLEVTGSPHVQNIPGTGKIQKKKETGGTPPVKKIIEKYPVPPSSLSGKKERESSSLQLGTYCSRCGTRVPEGSVYCNRCGSKIFVPDRKEDATFSQDVISRPLKGKADSDIRWAEDIGTPDARKALPADQIPSEPLWQQEPKTPAEQEPDSSFMEPVLFAKAEQSAETDTEPDTGRPLYLDSLPPESIQPVDKTPKRPWDRFSFKPGKKAVIGIVVIIIIIAIVLGGFFLYPMISNAPGNTTGEDGSPATHATVIPATTVKNTGTSQTPTHLPTENPTYYGGPGNSPANVGL
jgi:DNA-directed RNA polymerase subunit RPC12/RpoP